MENESQFDELLVKYLSNEADPAEEAAIREWIESSDQNRWRFEEMRRVWHLVAVPGEMDKIDTAREWERFKLSAHRRWLDAVSGNMQEAGAEENGSSFKKKHSIRYWIRVASAVAAAVILACGVFWMEGYREETSRPVAATKEAKPESHALTRQHERNTSGETRQLFLEDGTLVLLSNNSELVFQQPFAGKSRDVTLFGKAEFQVAKDKAKPFSVYSGEIMTTALGTRFSVADIQGATSITVTLYEGAVVVRPVDSVKTRLKQDYYLSPGQQLVFNRKSSAVVLKKFPLLSKGNEEKEGSGYDLPLDNPTIPQGGGSWYMFNNQSLAKVFDQLQDMYNVEIDYSAEEVRNKYFIGKFNRTDSLERILRQIATLNNLEVVKESGKFMIRKQK